MQIGGLVYLGLLGKRQIGIETCIISRQKCIYAASQMQEHRQGQVVYRLAVWGNMCQTNKQ